VTDNIYCLLITITKDDRNTAAVNLKLNFLNFSTSLNSSLDIFVQTYNVNYRNALDRLRVSYEHYLVSYWDLVKLFDLYKVTATNVSCSVMSIVF